MIGLTNIDKKNMKQFKLENELDFVIYLQELIVRTYKCIQKQKRYLLKLSNYIQKVVDENNGKGIKEIKIKYEDYSEFVDMLSGVESYVVNLIGDCTTSAMSYMKFRKMALKRNKKDANKIRIRNLNENVDFLIKDFNRIRNWQNHVPESLLLAEIKLIKEGGLLPHSENPIIINEYQYCTMEYIQDLYDSSYSFYKGVRVVHQSMKKDYSSLIGESMRIEKRYIKKPVGTERSEATIMSADIQGIKGRLDK